MFAKSPVFRLYEPAGLFSGRGDSPHYSIVPAFMNREPLQYGPLPGISGTAPGPRPGTGRPHSGPAGGCRWQSARSHVVHPALCAPLCACIRFCPEYRPKMYRKNILKIFLKKCLHFPIPSHIITLAFGKSAGDNPEKHMRC